MFQVKFIKYIGFYHCFPFIDRIDLLCSEWVYKSILHIIFQLVFSLFAVSKLTVSAGNAVKLQLPKDETVLTCFVLEKETPGRICLKHVEGGGMYVFLLAKLRFSNDFSEYGRYCKLRSLIFLVLIYWCSYCTKHKKKYPYM